ncbi:MAG: hypothetical protein LBD99_05485 [Candidatus Margulisbacteria bacterium]|jgi:hypothetical protein|nr:hypothetical protein [Candidatus Margulisiibacteriota bacterium]
MLVLVIGICMSLGLWSAVYLGFKEKYSASEGTLALLVLEILFLSSGLIIYGLAGLFR